MRLKPSQAPLKPVGIGIPDPQPSASPAARRSGSDPPPGQALEPQDVVVPGLGGSVSDVFGHFLGGFIDGFCGFIDGECVDLFIGRFLVVIGDCWVFFLIILWDFLVLLGFEPSKTRILISKRWQVPYGLHLHSGLDCQRVQKKGGDYHLGHCKLEILYK